MTDRTDYPAPGHVDEILALMAMGAADVEDEAVAGRHLVSCERCRLELESLEAAADALSLNELRAPSPDLWNRIESSLSGAKVEPLGGHRAAPWSRWLPWSVAAAALLVGMIAGSGLVYVARDRDDTSPLDAIDSVATDDVVFTLASVDSGSGGAGRIFMNTKRTEGVVAVTGLGPLLANERYSVWIVTSDDIRISAGTFTVDSEGSAVSALTLPELPYDWTTSSRYVALSISRVTIDDVNTPLGGPILVGPLY